MEPLSMTKMAPKTPYKNAQYIDHICKQRTVTIKMIKTLTVTVDTLNYMMGICKEQYTDHHIKIFKKLMNVLTTKNKSRKYLANLSNGKLLANVIACCINYNNTQLFVQLYGSVINGIRGKTIDDMINSITKLNGENLRCGIICGLIKYKLTQQNCNMIKKVWAFVKMNEGYGDEFDDEQDMAYDTIIKICKIPYSNLKLDILKLIYRGNTREDIMIGVIFELCKSKHLDDNYAIQLYSIENVNTLDMLVHYNYHWPIYNIVYDVCANNNTNANIILQKMCDDFDLHEYITDIYQMTDFSWLITKLRKRINKIIALVRLIDDRKKMRTLSYMFGGYLTRGKYYVQCASYIISSTVGIKEFVYHYVININCTNNDLKLMVNVNKYCKLYDGINNMCKRYVMLDCCDYLDVLYEASDSEEYDTEEELYGVNKKPVDQRHILTNLLTLLLIMKTGLLNNSLQYVLKRVMIPIMLQL